MPIPLVLAAIFEILEIVALATTVNELLTLLEDLFEGYQKFGADVEAAKKALREIGNKLKSEIASKVSAEEEMLFLHASMAGDPQRPETQQARGRGSEVPVIRSAIEQKVPFRKVISAVCDQAHQLPLPSLRKKRGVELKDLPSAKKKALMELLRLSAEELAGVELDALIVVRLRQLAVSLIFEFIDSLIDWQSPMKAEVSFGAKPAYADHPVQGATRLTRSGSGVNPFYPGPFFRQTGSLTADLVITERRLRRCDKNNVFALVEIKFPGDRIDRRQFENYKSLLNEAADTKTAHAPVRRDNKRVNSGGRLSLFRYPEDRAAEPHHEGDPAKKPRPSKPPRRKDGH